MLWRLLRVQAQRYALCNATLYNHWLHKRLRWVFAYVTKELDLQSLVKVVKANDCSS